MGLVNWIVSIIDLPRKVAETRRLKIERETELREMLREEDARLKDQMRARKLDELLTLPRSKKE